MRRVSMTPFPANSSWVRLNEIGQRYSKTYRSLPETLQYIRGPRQLEKMHFAHFTISKWMDRSFNYQCERVVCAAQGSVGIGNPEPVTSHQASPRTLASGSAQMRLHGSRPVGRVHDECAYGFGPQSRILSGNQGRHASRLRRCRAGTPAKNKGHLSGSKVGR